MTLAELNGRLAAVTEQHTTLVKLAEGLQLQAAQRLTEALRLEGQQEVLRELIASQTAAQAVAEALPVQEG